MEIRSNDQDKLKSKLGKIEETDPEYNVSEPELSLLIKQNKTLTSEYELALLQIHQLQEELESLYVEYQQALVGKSELAFGEKSSYLYDWLKTIKKTRNYHKIKTAKKRLGRLELALDQNHTELINQLRGDLSGLEAGNLQLSSENNKIYSESVGLQKKLIDVESANSKLIAENAHLSSVSIDLQEKLIEVEGVSSKLIAENDQLSSELGKQKEGHIALESLNLNLINEKQQLSSDIFSLQKKVDGLQGDFTKKENDLKSELSKLVKDKNQFDAEYKKITDDNRLLALQNGQLKESKKMVDSRLEKAISRGELNQKMLAKAQIDLEDIRKSYAEKVENEKELVGLIKELKEKLTLASKYYFKLQEEHPELISSQSQQGDEGRS